MLKVGKLNLSYLMAVTYACLLKNEPHKHSHWVVLSKLQEVSW